MKANINQPDPLKQKNTDEASKWQELANFLARKNREFSIIEDMKDPELQKIHIQRDKLFINTIEKKS